MGLESGSFFNKKKKINRIVIELFFVYRCDWYLIRLEFFDLCVVVLGIVRD